MQPQILEPIFREFDCIIVESFGVGGLPEYSDFYTVIKQNVEKGKRVIMTTQVPNEGSDLTVYHVGGRLKRTVDILEAYDMTTETALAKLMWIMGQTNDYDEIEKAFYSPVANDILHFGN